MSSRFNVDGVPRDCTAAAADADNPGNPAAMNCGGRMFCDWSVFPDIVPRGLFNSEATAPYDDGPGRHDTVDKRISEKNREHLKWHMRLCNKIYENDFKTVL